MNKSELIATLQQIKELAEAVLLKQGNPPSAPNPKAKQQNDEKREGVQGHILRLRTEVFFKQPRTANEVHAEVEKIYHCDLNRVAVALLRMQKRKELRKSSKTVGEKQKVAYVW